MKAIAVGTVPHERANTLAVGYAGYDELLGDLKACVQATPVRAVLAVNSELVQLHWSMGADISHKMREEG